MRRDHGGWWALLLPLLLVLASAPCAPGQVEVPVAGDEEGFEAMQRRIVAFVNAIVDYTREVRLTPEGVESVLAHHAALVALHGGQGAEPLIERALVDGRYDFDVMADDPTYAAWSREQGLDGEALFRQLLRLQALLMRKESLESLDAARAEMPEERTALEQMREEMGEESYQENLSELDAAASMVEEARALMESLPVATAEEAALLRTHAERIRATLESDEISE